MIIYEILYNKELTECICLIYPVNFSQMYFISITKILSYVYGAGARSFMFSLPKKIEIFIPSAFLVVYTVRLISIIWPAAHSKKVTYIFDFFCGVYAFSGIE